MKKDELIRAVKDNELEDSISMEDVPKPETTRPQLFQDVMKPDMQKDIKIRMLADGIKRDIDFFTKEMKTSFISQEEKAICEEILDIAKTSADVGSIGFAVSMLVHVNTKLALAPSVNGALLRLMNTEYNIKQMSFDTPKKRFFQRGGEQIG